MTDLNHGTDTGTSHGSTVLIEDFTGHYCGNCPAAHEILIQLLDKYKERLVPLCIHAGFFAGTTFGENYTTDYTTPEGNVLFDYFNSPDPPVGLVNRTPSENPVLTKDTWDAAIAEQLKKPAPVHINIQNTFDVETRKLGVMTEVIILKDTDLAISISVYLSEDSLISGQLDYNAVPSDIPDYIHRYVFRASLNGTFGEVISTGKIYKGDILEKNYFMTLPPEFNEKHCNVIVFVSDDETKEVLHVHQNNQFFLIE
jgi:thiol-disulfide isomerase/thioredoxin